MSIARSDATDTAALPGAGPLQDLAAVKRTSVRGGAITLAAQAVAIAIQLTSTFTLARLLGPEEHGTIAMVSSVAAFAGLFRDLGLSAAAVQARTLTHAQQTSLFWLNVAVGIALTLALAAASPLVAAFYRRPELVLVTVAMSTSFSIGSLSAQSRAWLVRQMQFGRQAASGISGALVTLLVSVMLAVNGAGYWSLVWGHIAGAATTTILLLALAPIRPSWPSSSSTIRTMVRLGASVTAFDVVNYFQRNLDHILIGRFIGTEALGIYSRAYALLMFPISNLRGPLNAVAFPAMSRLQSDPIAFRRYYLKVTSLLALLSMPLTAFLFAASDLVVEVLLGERWSAVSPIFSCLALAAFVQPASGLAGTLLISLGQGQRYFRCGLFNTIILSACMVIGLRWGSLGIAISYTVGNYIVLYPWLRWAFAGSPIRFGDFARACAAPAAVSIAAALSTIAVREALNPGSSSTIGQLGVSFVTFVAAFLVVAGLTGTGRGHLALLAELVAETRRVATGAQQ